ncbi:MAG: hypothetical protein MHPSP_002817, partial [Paramarteilia canceri]
MDNSTIRRGKKVWHKVDDRGLDAINDSLQMFSMVNMLIKSIAGDDMNLFANLSQTINS